VIRKSFRYRIYPNTRQAERLAGWCDALRFLWNIGNEQIRHGLARPRSERRYFSAFDQGRQLGGLRSELPWLADVPRDASEYLLSRLERAWRDCFRGAGEPHWKRKGIDHVPIREAHARSWRLSSAGLHFPKLGPLGIVMHRPLEGRRRSVSLTREGDQWFASILCELDVPNPAPRTEPILALDRGVVNLVADSDGKLTPNPRHLDRTLARLARAQRTVSRRQKGSKNREKAKLRVSRLHRKVRRQRDHVLHQVSSAYAKSHGTVVVEKLNVSGMSSGGGARKRGLNRSIASAGWSRLVEMLRYKLLWSGGRLVEVPAAYSSQTCSACGTVDGASRLSQSAFRCTSCGHEDHADLNAAKVLKTRLSRPWKPVEGMRSKAPGDAGNREGRTTWERSV
jgi:putative transposase